MEYVSPAESAVLSYAMPLISIPISYAILSEKATTSQCVGAVVGFVGVLIYSLSLAYSRLTVLGALLTLVNAFFWAMYTVYYRKLRNQDPTMTVATQFSLVALLFLIFAPLNYTLVASPSFWFDLAYLSVANGPIAFYAWNAMARLQKIGKTSPLIYSIPITTTLVQSVQSSILPSPISLTGVCAMTLGISVSRINRTK